MIEVNGVEKEEAVSIFNEVSKLGHEELVFCNDQATGLKAIIGIHNTVLGPALGGTRMWNYINEDEAIVDVLRLSRGMTFKASISGLNLGGGKAVIIGDARKQKSDPLLRRFGQFVESLNGKYITAEDVNMSPRDMEQIAKETKHVTGLSESIGGGGDPSPFTAYGVYMGMKASAKEAYGTDKLEGRKVAVQGVGHVGYYLVKYLIEEGAMVSVCDIYDDKIKAIKEKFDVEIINQDSIYDAGIDIYAPCALGATINDNTIDRIKCDIIAGGANNQLEDEEKHGRVLMEKGIIYAPDFLINAGGLINVGVDHLEEYSREKVYSMVENIYNTTLDILKKSKNENISSQEAAIMIAEKRIEDTRKNVQD